MPDPITEREKTIASVFYHPRTGFGSIENTLVEARKADPHITRANVRTFIAKQEIRQRRKPLKVNSFVADLPRQEFQVDLLDMGQRATPRYGLTAIDIFTKKGACIPIADKNANTTAEAMEKVFSELGYPSSVMSDEGAEFDGRFAEVLKREAVEQLKSRTGGRFVERFIRTLKKPLYERRRTLGGAWTQYVQDVVDKCNDSVQSSTKYKPDALAEDEYDFPKQEHAYQNQLAKAKFPVKHSTIEVGDHVKIRVKPAGYTDYKETFNSWSNEVYTVETIDKGAQDGQDRFHLTGYRRPLLRFELLKVADVQRYKNGELVSALDEVKHPRPSPVASAAPPVFRPGTRSTPGRQVHVPTPGGSSSSSGPAGAAALIPGPLPRPGPHAIRVATPMLPRRTMTRSQSALQAAAAAPIVPTPRRPVTRSQTRI